LAAGLIAPTGLNFVRLFTGPDGATHLDEVHYSMAKTKHGLIAENVQVNEIALDAAESAGGDGTFAVSPSRQLLIPLAGRVEVEASDGSKRILGVGQILLAEDTTGKGHRIRTLDAPRLLLVAPLLDKKRAPSGLLW
jgi:hypothetical protein